MVVMGEGGGTRRGEAILLRGHIRGEGAILRKGGGDRIGINKGPN